jgi:hypothetical protein
MGRTKGFPHYRALAPEPRFLKLAEHWDVLQPEILSSSVAMFDPAENDR